MASPEGFDVIRISRYRARELLTHSEIIHRVNNGVDLKVLQLVVPGESDFLCQEPAN